MQWQGGSFTNVSYYYLRDWIVIHSIVIFHSNFGVFVHYVVDTLPGGFSGERTESSPQVGWLSFLALPFFLPCGPSPPGPKAALDIPMHSGLFSPS